MFCSSIQFSAVVSLINPCVEEVVQSIFSIDFRIRILKFKLTNSVHRCVVDTYTSRHQEYTTFSSRIEHTYAAIVHHIKFHGFLLLFLCTSPIHRVYRHIWPSGQHHMLRANIAYPLHGPFNLIGKDSPSCLTSGTRPLLSIAYLVMLFSHS